MKIIMKSDGTPFNTEIAARAGATRQRLETFNIITVEGGYAIQEEGETQMEESAQEVPIAKEEKVSTKKHDVTEPWNPARLMDIPAKHKNPNFVYRFVDRTKPGNVDKKIAEGWEIDTELSRKMQHRMTSTPDDGKPLDSTLQIRELIVMRLPKERAKARAEYYARLASDAQNEAQEVFEGAVGRRNAYGNINESKD